MAQTGGTVMTIAWATLVPTVIVASNVAVPALPAGVVAVIVAHHDAGRRGGSLVLGRVIVTSAPASRR
jgi:hypothetical protein